MADLSTPQRSLKFRLLLGPPSKFKQDQSANRSMFRARQPAGSKQLMADERSRRNWQTPMLEVDVLLPLLAAPKRRGQRANQHHPFATGSLKDFPLAAAEGNGRSDRRGRSYLCKSAINKQFRSGDVTAVVRGEKDHGAGDLSRVSEASQWNRTGNALQTFLPHFGGAQ